MLGMTKIKSCPSFNWSTKINTEENEETKIKKYKQVNQYLILSKLGEGSYSKVYLGQDQNTFKYYALKRVQLKALSKIDGGLLQLRFEIEIMRKMKHRNIVSLHEIIHVATEKVVYLVIEYANCGSLSSLIKSNFTFTSEQIQSIFSQIVNGISFIHKNSIVHQDIKPANLLLNSEGKVLITDFGIGHSFENDAKVVGTPAYQAPEVIFDSKDNVDDGKNCKNNPAQEDVWSLGVTLYELAFKKLPFDGNNVFEIVHSISINDLLEKPSPCDSDLWDIIIKMLKVDPKKRITIPEIMMHPYFINASLNKNSFSNVKAFVPPHIGLNSKITCVNGTVFDENSIIFQSQNKSVLREDETFTLFY